jgi:hypothetical protein
MLKSIESKSISRRRRGLLGTLLLLPCILMLFIIIALGVDFSHLCSIRSQCQNAADAAAYAGACKLFSSPDLCDSYALSLASANLVEGRQLYNVPGEISVVSQTVRPEGNNLGTVTVTIDFRARDMIFPLCQRYLDRIKVVAVAGAAGSLKKTYINSLFPIAVSLDAVPSKGNSLLNSGGVGHSFTMDFNSQKYKNAGFTSFTVKNNGANWLTDAIAQCLGITGDKYDPVTIPSVAIGDDIFLNNGIDGQKRLGDDPFFSKLCAVDRVIVLPVISGEPAYNKSRECIGFVALHVSSVEKGQNGVVLDMTCEIVGTSVPGMSGTIPPTGDGSWDTIITQVDPKVVKMLR